MNVKTKAQPATKPAPPATPRVSVLIKPETRPGLKACGGYEVGKVYAVPANEAVTLTTPAKGFECATEGDASTLREWVAADAVYQLALEQFNNAAAAVEG